VCRGLGVAVEVVNRIASGRFEVLPRRRVVERTWSWPMNNCRRQVDYERDPKASEGVVRAAHSPLLLRRLTS
jgi:putative transposase